MYDVVNTTGNEMVVNVVNDTIVSKAFNQLTDEEKFNLIVSREDVKSIDDAVCNTPFKLEKFMIYSDDQGDAFIFEQNGETIFTRSATLISAVRLLTKIVHKDVYEVILKRVKAKTSENRYYTISLVTSTLKN